MTGASLSTAVCVDVEAGAKATLTVATTTGMMPLPKPKSGWPTASGGRPNTGERPWGGEDYGWLTAAEGDRAVSVQMWCQLPHATVCPHPSPTLPQAARLQAWYKSSCAQRAHAPSTQCLARGGRTSSCCVAAQPCANHDGQESTVATLPVAMHGPGTVPPSLALVVYH